MRTEILYVIIAVLIGICFPFADVVIFLMLCIVIALASFFSIGLLITSIFLGKKAIKWGLILIIPVMVAIGATTVTRNYKHNKAIQIQSRLENYRKERGTYPKDLSEVTKISLDGLKYYPDQDQKNYMMMYLRDGFNWEYYSSSQNKWGTLGWND